jgi:imidazolonepropionase-like amidohydrolase
LIPAILFPLALAGCRIADEQSKTIDSASLIITGATLVDPQTGRQRPDVTIIVTGDRIAFVGEHPEYPLPPAGSVIDATGQWVIPGLIDVHVHDASSASLRGLLDWGVTSIQLMPNSPPLGPALMERNSRDPGSPTPRLQVTAMFAGAFPENLVPAYQFLKPETPAEARHDVARLHSNGYRQIKIIQDDTTLWAGPDLRSQLMPDEVVEALVEEARAQDMRVYVHATQRSVAQAALEQGLDAFMHGVMDARLTTKDWHQMRKAGTVWTPAYNAPYVFGDRRTYARRIVADPHLLRAMSEDDRMKWKSRASADSPIVMPAMTHLVEHTPEYMEVLGGNTRRALSEGVTVAVGSDGGPSGVSTQLELEFMQENGCTPLECLAAATEGGALALGWEADVGSIAVGKLADLVVLSANPALDIRNCRSIAYVVKGGAIY